MIANQPKQSLGPLLAEKINPAAATTTVLRPRPNAAHISLSLLALASIFALWVVHYQFTSYDLSPLIDLSHRLKAGEVPGRDFINTLPPMLLLAVQAVSFGTLHWADLTWSAIIISWLTFFALLLIDPRLFASRSSAFCIGVLLSTPLIYTNHVWHSTISQQAAICFVATLLALDQVYYERKNTLFFAIVASATVLALAKQNVGAPILVAGILSIAANRIFSIAYRAKLIGLILTGIAIALLIAVYVQGFRLSSLLYIYTSVASRLKPTGEMFDEIFRVRSNYAVMLILCMAATLALRNGASVGNRFAYFLLPTSLIPLVTDWDSKINDVLLALFLLLIIRLPLTKADSRKILTWSSLLLLTAFVGGLSRERMHAGGPFYQVPDNQIIANGYFEGVRTGSTFVGVLAEINRLPISADELTFFGTRLEFGYTIKNLPSPKGFPLWWHPGTSFAADDESDIVERALQGRFRWVIFLRGDYWRMPYSVLEALAGQCDEVSGYRFLEVYDCEARNLSGLQL